MNDTVEKEQFNIQTEQALLGAILLNNDCIFDAESLEEHHFYEGLHSRIFDACRSTIASGRIANPVTLNGHFQDDDDMIAVGGTGYLASLVSAAISLRHVADYSALIRSHHKRRALKKLAIDLTDISDETLLDLSDNDMSEHAEKIFGEWANEAAPDDNLVWIDDAVTETLTAFTEASTEDGTIGVSTGLEKLDDRIGGFRRGNSYIVAGRPGMGKSAIGCTFALNAAKNGHGVVYFSLEMEKKELVGRMLSDLACDERVRIPYSHIDRGNLDSGQFNAMGESSRRLRETSLIIEDSHGRTTSQIKASARKAARRFKKKGLSLDLIVIDHLQIIRGAKEYRGNKVQELTQISNDLKGLAKSLDVPVITLSQLSRQLENRENKRPLLPDLRYSGDIEQDADVVLFLYREAYYVMQLAPNRYDSGYDEWLVKYEDVKNDFEVEVAKQRQGPTGRCEMWTDIACNVIRDGAPGMAVTQEAMDFGQL